MKNLKLKKVKHFTEILKIFCKNSPQKILSFQIQEIMKLKQTMETESREVTTKNQVHPHLNSNIWDLLKTDTHCSMMNSKVNFWKKSAKWQKCEKKAHSVEKFSEKLFQICLDSSKSFPTHCKIAISLPNSYFTFLPFWHKNQILFSQKMALAIPFSLSLEKTVHTVFQV